MWITANVCYNLATDSLSMTISTPISSCGPNAVAFIVALFYKEIKGRKNFVLLFIGFFIALAGSVVCGLSL
jgi:glucose uptake protein GlcU